MPDEQAPPKKSKMKWIILLVVLLLLGGAGAGAWFFFLADMLHGSAGDKGAKHEIVTPQSKGPLLNGQIVSLPVFRVNLADPLGRRFIKLTLEVEATSPTAAQELEANQAPIRDSIILLLSSKSYADLLPSEGKVMLKTEIGERINQILGGPKVSQVFITEIIIQ